MLTKEQAAAAIEAEIRAGKWEYWMEAYTPTLGKYMSAGAEHAVLSACRANYVATSDESEIIYAAFGPLGLKSAYSRDIPQVAAIFEAFTPERVAAPDTSLLRVTEGTWGTGHAVSRKLVEPINMLAHHLLGDGFMAADGWVLAAAALDNPKLKKQLGQWPIRDSIGSHHSLVPAVYADLDGWGIDSFKADLLFADGEQEAAALLATRKVDPVTGPAAPYPRSSLTVKDLQEAAAKDCDALANILLQSRETDPLDHDALLAEWISTASMQELKTLLQVSAGARGSTMFAVAPRAVRAWVASENAAAAAVEFATESSARFPLTIALLWLLVVHGTPGLDAVAAGMFSGQVGAFENLGHGLAYVPPSYGDRYIDDFYWKTRYMGMPLLEYGERLPVILGGAQGVVDLYFAGLLPDKFAVKDEMMYLDEVVDVLAPLVGGFTCAGVEHVSELLENLIVAYPDGCTFSIDFAAARSIASAL